MLAVLTWIQELCSMTTTFGFLFQDQQSILQYTNVQCTHTKQMGYICLPFDLLLLRPTSDHSCFPC